MKHSIVCVMGCTGEWCDCPCHDSDSGEGGRAYGKMEAQDNSGPRPAFAPPTEGLATTPTGRPTS